MKYIVANWKMNMDLNDLNEWVDGFKKELSQIDLVSAVGILQVLDSRP